MLDGEKKSGDNWQFQFSDRFVPVIFVLIQEGSGDRNDFLILLSGTG